jgi:hypothetical protein
MNPESEISTTAIEPAAETRFAKGQVAFEELTGFPAIAFLDGLKNVAPILHHREPRQGRLGKQVSLVRLHRLGEPGLHAEHCGVIQPGTRAPPHQTCVCRTNSIHR